MSRDYLIHGMAADDTVRCLAVVTTDLVGEAMRRHATAPTATAALGRTLTGTLLLSATLQELDRLTVQIRGDGPIVSITAEAKADGAARGMVGNPQADAPLKAPGKANVGAIVGQGMFYVTREAGFEIGLRPEPYRGSVPLASGEIAEDFAHYLAASEQIPSAVLLGVLLEPDSSNGHNNVTAAGGIMLQMMPGANETTLATIEQAVSQLPHTTTLIRAGATPRDLLQAALGGLPFTVLGEKEVRFACTCSRERAVSIIASLPRAEVLSMLQEDGQATLNCHFCNETYQLDRAVLEDML